MEAKQTNQRETFNVPEAAGKLGVSPALIYKAVSAGEIKSIRVGGRILIPRYVIEQLLETAKA